MFINAMIGGTPGKNCGGFCKFCYFRSVDFNNLYSIKLGCKYCPPDQIGCNHCQEIINDIKNGFKPSSQVISNVINVLNWHEMLGSINYDNLKITVCSSADIIFYPHLIHLISEIKKWGLKVHLGYTSGKGINDEKIVDKLISIGVDEINFSVLSTNTAVRKTWMGDKTPEVSLNALKLFCQNIDVNATTVVIPNVIDEGEIFSTCSELEEWGIKTFMLSRFVNFKYQGLILNQKPVISGVDTQTYEEFQELVKKVSDEFSFRVVGSPFNDPKKNIPYALSKKENIKYLRRLPPVTEEATIITSKLSYKPLKKIFETIAGDKVNVVALDKEIGDLITHEDLALADLDDIKDRVIIPGGALVHDKVTQDILSKDGRDRTVFRGPNLLFFYDFEQLSKEDAIKYELNSFKVLIDRINYSSI